MDESTDTRMFLVVAGMLLLVLAADVAAIAFHWTSADTIMNRGHTMQTVDSPIAGR